MDEIIPFVDLVFPISGRGLPTDHGYALFSAISRMIPEAHDAKQLGIHTIQGLSHRPRELELLTTSRLRLRLPLDSLSPYYKLTGKTLRVERYTVSCGIPSVYLLQPKSNLRARTVIIKSARFSESIDPEEFLAALNKQLEQTKITATLSLLRAPNGVPVRRVMRVHGVPQVDIQCC